MPAESATVDFMLLTILTVEESTEEDVDVVYPPLPIECTFGIPPWKPGAPIPPAPAAAPDIESPYGLYTLALLAPKEPPPA